MQNKLSDFLCYKHNQIHFLEIQQMYIDTTLNMLKKQAKMFTQIISETETYSKLNILLFLIFSIENCYF